MLSGLVLLCRYMMMFCLGLNPLFENAEEELGDSEGLLVGLDCLDH
jgi:hypothetical protein